MSKTTALSHKDIRLKNNSRHGSATIKESVKSCVQSGQKNHRERILISKRLKVETLEEVNTALLSEEDQKDRTGTAIKELKSGKKLDPLTVLHRAFAKDYKNADLFIKLDGLPALVGCFFAPDSDILQAAAWCAVNLTAVFSLSNKQVQLLSPVLIQYCLGSDVAMQEMCAWALGNIADDSDYNKDVLVQQGGVPALTSLVRTPEDLMHQARTDSVLFALANLTRGSYQCVRCLQENNVYKHIVMILESLPLMSESSCHLGWLINNIYIRDMSWKESGEQYPAILQLVLGRLAEMLEGNTADRRQEILPYLRCVGNMIGQSADLAVKVGDQVTFHNCIAKGLDSGSDIFVQNEILWILSNFVVEPSCCGLVMFQPHVTDAALRLCQSSDERLSFSALTILDRASRVSGYLCSYMTQRGGLYHVCPLLSSPQRNVGEKALNLVLVMMKNSSFEMEQNLKEQIETHLKMLLSPDVPVSMYSKAKQALKLLS